MNFFELFEMPVKFIIDRSYVSKKHDELSRRYQPDHHTQKLSREQGAVLEKSSMINKAYKTFQNPDETIKYVLKLKDLFRDEEKFELDPEFEAKVIDINDQLVKLQVDNNEEQLEEVELKAKELLTQIYDEVLPILENYKDDSASEKELLQVKDYYYRKKYLQGLLDKIYQIRNIASHI